MSDNATGVNAKAKSNAAALNAKLKSTGTTEDTSALGKICSYYSDLVTARTAALTDYESLAKLKNVVSQDLLFSLAGDYYRLKARSGLSSFTNCLKMMGAVSSDGEITALIKKLYDLVAAYYAAEDEESKKLIKAKIDSVLGNVGLLLDGYKGGTAGFLPSDATYDPTTGEVKTAYALNGTSSDPRTFKMLYGKVKQSGLIAQETALQLKLLSDDSMFATAPYLDMVGVNFEYKEYAPIDIWPINLFWKEGRYASPSYEVENDDAKSKDDMYKTVYSLIYFNGGRFGGSTELGYSDIKEGDVNSGKLIADTSKNNILSGTIKASKEVKARTATFTLKNDDESVNPATNADTAISDSISVDIISGETDYEAKGDLYLDTELSKENDCSAYTGSLKVTKGLSGSDTSTSILTMQVICLLSKSGTNAYSIELRPDADSTSNTVSLDEYSDSEVIIGCALCQYEGTITFSSTMADTAGVQAMKAICGLTSSLASMPESSSAASTLISDALNKLASLEGSLRAALNESLSAINAALYSFSSLDALQTTNDTNYEKEYVNDAKTAFSDLQTSISSATSDTDTPIEDAGLDATIDSGLEEISSKLEDLRSEAISGFHTINGIMDDAGMAFPKKSGYMTAANTIDVAFDTITGNSLTKETYSSAGTTLVNIPVRMKYDAWKAICGNYMADDGYLAQMIFLIDSLYAAIYAAYSKDGCLAEYRSFYSDLLSRAYSLRILSGTVISDGYKEEIEEAKDLYKRTGMEVKENANAEFVSPFLTYISPSLSGFDQIDIEELAGDMQDASDSASKSDVLTARIARWKPYVYKAFGLSSDIAALASALSSALERIESNMTIRDAVLGACLYSAISDVTAAADQSSELYSSLSTLNPTDKAATYRDYVSEYMLMYGRSYLNGSDSISSMFSTEADFKETTTLLKNLKG